MEIVKIETLVELANGKAAEDRGLTELIENGYKNDMAEMFGCVYLTDDIEDVEFEIKNDSGLTVEQTKTVIMAFWGRGKLYNSSNVKAVKYKELEGWWTEVDFDNEWMI